VPNLGDSFTVLTCATRVGDFATYAALTLGGGKTLQASLSGTSVILTVVSDR
jgi:hypothetical protein